MREASAIGKPFPILRNSHRFAGYRKIPERKTVRGFFYRCGTSTAAHGIRPTRRIP